MANKKEKLQKLLNNLSDRDSGVQDIYNSVDLELADIAAKLKKSVELKTLSEANDQFKKLEKLFKAIPPSFEELKRGIQERDKKLLSSIQEKNLLLVQMIEEARTQSNQLSGEESSKRADEINSLQSDINSLREDLAQSPDVRKLLSISENKIYALIGSLEESIVTKADFTKTATDLDNGVTSLRTELERLSRLGGGSAPRQINVSSSVMSTRFADINFVSNTAIKWTATDDTVNKRVNLTASLISGGSGGGAGTPGGANQQVQFNDNGAFGGSSTLTWNKDTSVLGVPDIHITNGSADLNINQNSNINFFDTASGNETFFTQGGTRRLGVDFQGTVKLTGSSVVTSHNTLDDGSGNVGIGTTTPHTALEISGGGTYTQGILVAGATQSGNFDIDTVRYISPGGAIGVMMNSSGLNVGRAGSYTFTDGSVYPWLTVPDANISRIGAKKIGVGNGTAGDTSGTFVASNIGIGTPTPVAPLDVEKAIGNTIANFGNGQFGDLQIDSQNSPTNRYRIYTDNSSPDIELFTSGGNILLDPSNTGKVGINNPSPQARLDIGTPSSIAGTLRMQGSTAGYVQLQPASTAGSWTFTLPNSSGANAQYLMTDGNGITQWASVVATGGSGISRNTSIITANTTGGSTGSTDYVYIATNSLNFTLPNPVGNGNLYTVKNATSSSVVVTALAGKTIDGSGSVVSAINNQSLDFISDGNVYRII